MDREAMRDTTTGRFLPGNTSGRPSGLANKVNRTLRECVLMAGEIVGSDGKGKDGLTGYLTNIARTDPRAYLALLGRLMPIDVRTTETTTVQTYRSIEEIEADMRARGLTPDRLAEMAADMAARAKANGNGGLNGGGNGSALN